MVFFCLLLFIVWLVLLVWFVSKPKRAAKKRVLEPCLKKQTLNREVRLSVVDYKQDAQGRLSNRSAILSGNTPTQLRGIREYKRTKELAVPNKGRVLPTRVEPTILTKETSTQTDGKGVTIRSMTTRESWTKEYTQPRHLSATGGGQSKHYWMLTSLLLSGVIIVLLALYVTR